MAFLFYFFLFYFPCAYVWIQVVEWLGMAHRVANEEADGEAAKSVEEDHMVNWLMKGIWGKWRKRGSGHLEMAHLRKMGKKQCNYCWKCGILCVFDLKNLDYYYVRMENAEMNLFGNGRLFSAFNLIPQNSSHFFFLRIFFLSLLLLQWNFTNSFFSNKQTNKWIPVRQRPTTQPGTPAPVRPKWRTNTGSPCTHRASCMQRYANGHTDGLCVEYEWENQFLDEKNK